MPDFPPIGKFYEDIVPGEERLTPGRTVNPADIDMFAEWTGDRTFQNLRAPDGRRIVSPILIVNIADDLSQRIGWVEGTGYCNLGWTWTFHRPLYEMDTMWVRIRWKSARESRSLPHVGIVDMDLTVVNQDEQDVATATWTVMILRRQPGEGTQQPAAAAAVA